MRLHAQQALGFNNTLRGYGKKIPCEDLKIEKTEIGYFATSNELGLPFDTMYGAFALEEMSQGYTEKKCEKTLVSKKKYPVAYKNYCYTYANLYTEFHFLSANQYREQ